jgi:hypothetical protein
MCKLIQFPYERVALSRPSIAPNKDRRLPTRSFLSFVSAVKDRLDKGQISMETAHAMLEAFLIMQGEK